MGSKFSPILQLVPLETTFWNSSTAELWVRRSFLHVSYTSKSKVHCGGPASCALPGAAGVTLSRQACGHLCSTRDGAGGETFLASEAEHVTPSNSNSTTVLNGYVWNVMILRSLVQDYFTLAFTYTKLRASMWIRWCFFQVVTSRRLSYKQSLYFIREPETWSGELRTCAQPEEFLQSFAQAQTVLRASCRSASCPQI